MNAADWYTASLQPKLAYHCTLFMGLRVAVLHNVPKCSWHGSRGLTGVYWQAKHLPLPTASPIHLTAQSNNASVIEELWYL